MREEILNQLGKGLEDLEKYRRLASDAEKFVKEQLIRLEKDTFNGKTFSEHMNSLYIEEEKEGVVVRVNRWTVEALLDLGNGAMLTADGTIYEGQSFGVKIKYTESERESTKIPDKYQKQYEHLLKICNSYKVINPARKYQQEFNLTSY